MSSFGQGKVIFVVMTSSQDRYAELSCISAFSEMNPALAYAEQVMTDAIRDEGRGLEIDEIEHDEGQYVVVLSHEGLDFKVIIDYCADRTGEK